MKEGLDYWVKVSVLPDVGRTGGTYAAKGTISTVAPGTTQYIWPIPLSELLVNRTCRQNAGY